MARDGGERWYRGDCHVHSRRSHGGEMTPTQLASGAREVGLDFIAVTEHNIGYAPEDWVDAASGLLVIPGQEVVTETGHWLALGIPPGHVVDWRYGVRDGRVDSQVERVHHLGGACVAAHPHAPYPSGTFMYPFERFDAVEVWNGQWTSDLPWNADNEAALAEWGRGLAAGIHRGRWLPAIGNSDVHLHGQIGTPQTVVRAAEHTTEALLAGIRAGRCWIAGSAAVHLALTASAGDQSAGIGDHVKAGGDAVVVRVEVSGVPSGTVTFHTERGRAHQEMLPAEGTGVVEWSTSGRESTFVRVEIRQSTGHMAALTNPVILSR